MQPFQTLLEKIENAKTLDFGDLVSESIELFKKVWVQGLLLQVFTLVVFIPLIAIFYVPLLGFVITEQGNNPEGINDFVESMSIPYILIITVGFIVLGVVVSALNAAFYRIIKRVDNGDAVTSSDFFYFIKEGRLKRVAVLTLIGLLLIIPSALLCYIPLIYMVVPLAFLMPVFVYNETLSLSEVLKLSFKIANKNWLIAFGLIVLAYMAILVIGMLSCGIGQFFLQTFVYLPSYLIYKHVVDFDMKTDIDKIGATAL